MMIQTDIRGTMTCDAQGCGEHAPGKLVMVAGGGFAFKPAAKGWQFAVGPQGVYLSRCPKHKAAIVAANGSPIIDLPQEQAPVQPTPDAPGPEVKP